MKKPAVFLVNISLHALGDPLMVLPIFEEVAFLAESFQDGLKKQENMSFLCAGQKRHSFSKGCLILVCQRLAVLHSEISSQVFIERHVSFLYTLLPKFALEDLQNLLLIAPRGNFLARTERPLLREMCSHKLFDFAGRAPDGEIRGFLRICYELGVQLRILCFKLPYCLFELTSVLPLDHHLFPQSSYRLVLFRFKQPPLRPSLLKHKSLTTAQHFSQLINAIIDDISHLSVFPPHHHGHLPQGIQFQSSASVQQRTGAHNSIIAIQCEVLTEVVELRRQRIGKILREGAESKVLGVPADDIELFGECEQVLGGDVRVFEVIFVHMFIAYSSYLVMVRTEMIRLMTWNRKHFRLFPFGSSIYPLLLTLILIETPSILITYDLFLRDFHPQVLAPLLILLQISTLAALISCTYTDPGILPQIVDKYAWDQQQIDIPATNHLNLPEHKYLMAGGGLMTHQKYCVECYIYRPVRTIHCQVCNHCVERYDHHCPWLGVCIGKYNYRFFFLFIAFLSCLTATVTAISLAIIVDVMHSQPVHYYLIEIILAGVAGVFFFPVFKLFTYHVGLFRSRLTTNEDLKGLYQLIKGPVPFERCQTTSRPPLAPIKAQLILNAERDSQRSSSTNQNQNKGKRYSTLVSDRQSVLNYLVEAQL